MRNQQTTIAIVIPVYNEQDFIKDCLDSITNQTLLPSEVIIVDNNCTDATLQIVKRYKFTKIIKEPRQGQRFAQIAGFNYAKSEVIIRIDSDTVLPVDYVQKIDCIFKDKKIDAISGFGLSRTELVSKLSFLWSWFYFTYIHSRLGYPTLWGANLAFRKSIWAKAKKLVISNYRLHEDQDLALAIVSVGGKIKVIPRLTVSVQMDNLQDFETFMNYYGLIGKLVGLDHMHHRYNLASRLPKTVITKRIIMWLASAWSVYFYISVLAIIYCVKKINNTIRARLLLVARPQD